MGTIWTEEALCALEPHEHDFQEFKGSGWLHQDGEISPQFLIYLSKQVSSFANGAGGHLFIGLNDDGLIDGGVPTDLKGGGTRAWLEDVVPQVVDPHLARFNVYEVGPEGPDSRILPGRAVYVIHLLASSEAPHQAKDHRYYLRIAGKSRPMGHVHVQDVLRRTVHPQVCLSRMGPYNDAQTDLSDPRGPKVFIQFRVFIRNEGRVLARHVGVDLVVPRPFAGKEVRLKMRKLGESHYTQSPGSLAFFRYHPVPLFPTQEVYALSCWVELNRTNQALVRHGAAIKWTLYADDAEPARGARQLARFQVVQRALSWLDDPR